MSRPTSGSWFSDVYKRQVLFSSFADIWKTAGGTVAVTVGESVERGFADESAVLVDAGAGKTINTESLIAAEPDLIIGSLDIEAQADAVKLAAQAGIPAAAFKVEAFADYLRVLKICTAITGNAEAYETYGTAVQERVEEILQKAQPVSYTPLSRRGRRRSTPASPSPSISATWATPSH